MTRCRKIVHVFLLLLAATLTVMVLSLPYLLQSQAVAWVAQNTQRQLRIESITINPFTWRVKLLGVTLTESDSEDTFASFERLNLDIAALRSIWHRALIVNSLGIETPHVSIVKEGDRFNFSDLTETGEDTPKREGSGSPFLFTINNLVIHKGGADFQDLDRPEIVHQLRDLELALPFVGNVPFLVDRFIEPRLSLRLGNTPIEAEAALKPFAESMEATLRLKLRDIDLPLYSPYLPKERPVSIDHGRLALDVTLAYRINERQEPQVTLEGVLTLTSLRIVDRLGEELFFLPLAQVGLEKVDLLARQASIDQVALYGLEVFVSRDEGGEWNHARLAKETTPPSEPDAAMEKETSDETMPLVEIGKLLLRDGKIHFTDASVPDGFGKEIRELTVDVEGFSTRAGTADFTMEMQVDEGTGIAPGTVEVTGEVAMAPFALSVQVEADKLLLSGIEAYLPTPLSLQLTGGSADAALWLTLTPKKGKGEDNGDGPMVGQLRGGLGVRGLQLVEPQTDSDVLVWESLQVDGIQLDFLPGPTKLLIDEIALNSFLAKLLITGEGKVNLRQALGAAEGKEGKPEAEPDRQQARQEIAAAKQEKAAQDTVQIRIERVILQDGTLSFIDQHMQTPFETRLTRLGGRISGLGTGMEAPAELDLRGTLENHSNLRIEGKIDPFGDALYLDLKTRFDAIELTPMTPYSGTYLGYAIAKGMLYLDLDYRIEGNRLDASNSVFLDQFTFGQRLGSDQATKLPVKLAVALLKDRRGEIRLDLPVTGQLDDPQFSAVGVVFRILKNLLIKAATSPFKLLASLFGGEEDFSSISFPYGVSSLPEPEQAKLAKLASVLRERPGLKLEVSGFVDAENDPEAYRREQLQELLREAKLRKLLRAGRLPKDATAEQVTIEPGESGRYLKQVYRRADFSKPRNFLGLVKSLPDAEMEKLLLANLSVGDPELQLLAQKRAQAVRDHLIQAQGLPLEIIFLKKQDIYQSPDNQSGSLVAFGLATD